MGPTTTHVGVTLRLALVGLVVACQASAPAPSPASPELSPAARSASPATPKPPPVISWTTSPFPGGPITAALAEDEQWVALGPSEAWLLEGGSTWEVGSFGDVEVPPPTDPELRDYWSTPVPIDIVRHGNAWFAVALWDGPGDSTIPVVFRSVDGLEWSHHPSSGWWGFGPSALASNGSMLIATNVEYAMGQGSVFVSEDGMRWMERFAPGGPATMLDVFATQEMIVAVGYRYTDESLRAPVAWVSDDGLTWAESDPIVSPRATTPRAVARTASGTFVMLATVTTFPEGCSENSCLLETLGGWYSEDGRTWHPSGFPPVSAPFGSYTEISIVPIGDGLLAVTSTIDAASAAWATADGTTWTDAALIGPAGFSVSAAASDGAVVRLFDSTGTTIQGTIP